MFGVACCANCETCFLYKKLVNREEKSVGMACLTRVQAVQVHQVQKSLIAKGSQQVLLEPWTALLNTQGRRLMLQLEV